MARGAHRHGGGNSSRVSSRALCWPEPVHRGLGSSGLGYYRAQYTVGKLRPRVPSLVATASGFVSSSPCLQIRGRQGWKQASMGGTSVASPVSLARPELAVGTSNLSQPTAGVRTGAVPI